MKLRSHLILLVIAALLPVLIFAGVMLVVFSNQQRRAVEGGLVNTARALSLAVDRELEASIRTLQALGASQHLESGDLREFYEQARRVIKTQERWDTIVLFDSGERQVLNLLRPFGSPLPRDPPADPGVRNTIELKRPLVSNLFAGRISGQPRIAINVPIIRKGEVKYVLGANFSPISLLNLLKEQNLPSDWVTTITDKNNAIIAGTQDFEQLVGKPATALIPTKSSELEEGVFREISHEGVPVFTAFRRSYLSGWTVDSAIPVSALQTPLRRSLLFTAAGGLVLLLVGSGLATVFGRRIAASVGALSGLAASLGSGETPQHQLSRIIELDQVGCEMELAAARRKRAEEAVRESEKRFRAIFEEAPLGVAIIDSVTGQFQSINRKYCEIAGYSWTEMLSQTFQDITHPDDLPADLDNMKLLLDGQIDAFHMEKRYIRKDDTTVWVHLTCVPLWRSETERRFHIAMVEDITERKRAEDALRKSEERFQIAAKATNDAIWDWNMLTNELWWNDGVKTLFGYAAEEVGPDVPWWSDRIHPEDQGRILSSLHSLIESGKKFWSGEYRYRRADGSYADIFDRGYVVHDHQRKPVRMIGAMIDITQRKQAEERLRALAAHLQSVREEERTQIAREIHDELGQTLTGLKMDLSWLARKLRTDQNSLPEKIKSMSDLIDKTIQTVRRLSTDLRPGVLDDLGLEAAIEWQKQEFQNRTGIQCEFSSHLKDIHLDRDRSTALFRIFQETLTNVARHAQATKVKIGLGQENGNITLEVKDNGRGIETTNISDPKSLGLLGMRERAVLLGGEVKINGTKGKGTTVTVRIPLDKGNSS